MKFEAAKHAPEKKRSLAEEFAQDEAEMAAKKEAKREKVAKGVAEAFIDGVEDGSIDLKTVPEKDVPAWYDAVKARYDREYAIWSAKLKTLEDRLPTLEAEKDTSRPKPPPFFGEKGKRSKDQIAAEAIHEMSDTSERDAKERRGAERTAESFMDEIASGEIDLKTIPEKDIPGYHDAIKKKLAVWEQAKKTLEGRIPGFEEEVPDEKDRGEMAA